MGVILKVLLLQVVVFGVIITILRFFLEKELWSAAYEYLSLLPVNRALDTPSIVVMTAQPIEADKKQRLLALIQSAYPEGIVDFVENANLRGGVLIKIGSDHVDFSITSRMKALWNQKV